MHYYQFNIGDYTSHTRGLSLMEDLAYRRLIDEYYLNEQPLNSCSTRVARCLGMREQESEVSYVLETFFELEEDGWHHKRIDQELKDFIDAKEAKSRAGKASAAKRKAATDKQKKGSVEQKTTSDATGDEQNSTDVEQVLNSVQQTNNHKPVTNNQEPIKNIGDSVEPPQTTGKRRRKLPDDFQLTEARAGAAQSYWLQQGRSDLVPAVEFEKFCNHHRQHGKAMACWESAWKTWYANAPSFVKPAGVSSQPFGQRSTRDRTLTEDLKRTDW